MHDTIQDWKYLAKNFNSVNAKVIPNKALLRLGIHILATGYFEERAPHFTDVIGNHEEINEKAKTVFDLQKKVKIKRTFCKEKRDALALILKAACLFAFLSASMPKLLALSVFVVPMPKSSVSLLAFVSAIFVLKLSTPPSAAPVPIPGLFTLPSPSAVPMPWTSTFLSLSALLIPGSFTLLSLSAVLVPGLSALPSPPIIPVHRSSTFLSLFAVPAPYLLPYCLLCRHQRLF